MTTNGATTAEPTAKQQSGDATAIIGAQTTEATSGPTKITPSQGNGASTHSNSPEQSQQRIYYSFRYITALTLGGEAAPIIGAEATSELIKNTPQVVILALF